MQRLDDSRCPLIAATSIALRPSENLVSGSTPRSSSKRTTRSLIVHHGPSQLCSKQRLRWIDRVSEPSGRRTAVSAPEPELEEEHEVVVVAAEHPVVEHLAVVHVRAGFEEHPCESDRVGMAGLASGSSSPSPNVPVSAVKGDGRPCPQVADVRISAVLEEDPCGVDHPRLADSALVAPGPRGTSAAPT